MRRTTRAAAKATRTPTIRKDIADIEEGTSVLIIAISTPIRSVADMERDKNNDPIVPATVETTKKAREVTRDARDTAEAATNEEATGKVTISVEATQTDNNNARIARVTIGTTKAATSRVAMRSVAAMAAREPTVREAMKSKAATARAEISAEAMAKEVINMEASAKATTNIMAAMTPMPSIA